MTPIGFTKRLSNHGEQQSFEQVRGPASEYAAEVYRKVSVADVIDIDRLSNRALGTNALQAHFDICIADSDHHPALAIEYDGHGHSDRNDQKKDSICREAGFPLFRISPSTPGLTLNGMTFVEYIVHVWFMCAEFHRMKAEGKLPPDEPFMMCAFLHKDAKNVFDSPFDLLTPERARLNRFLKSHAGEHDPLAHLNTTHFVMGHEETSFAAFASFPLKGKFVYGRSKIDIATPSLGALEELPFGWSSLSDFCEGMSLKDLNDGIEVAAAAGLQTLRTLDEVAEEVRDLFVRGYKWLRAGSGEDTDFYDLLEFRT